ncbi:MAG: acyl-CoA/acyl-ACP dehydrogenase [Burkholderiales bacterium]|nr:acyl-CoA/acyl-ACP dehydrogenase [Burkholderiales bacterium]
MNEDQDIRTLLADSARRVFADHCSQEAVEAAKKSGWSSALWQVLERTQLTLVSIPEPLGGAGGTVADFAAVLRIAGRYSAPVPLAETGLLAGWLLAASGQAVPAGPLSAAPAQPAEALTLSRSAGAWRLAGTARRVPWARVATRLVALARYQATDWVVSVDPRRCVITPGSNLAWEPRDEVRFDAIALGDDEVVPAGAGVDLDRLYLRGALARAIAMAGALDRALELALTHAKTRVQFGRAIAKFQAVQQELARFAGEVAAAAAAALSAAGAVERGEGEFAVACAKVRAGEAASTGAAIAHQIHAAIGVTEEFALHHSTLRLQAWRAEYGSETYWGERLGEQVLAAGAERLWPRLTE